MRSDNLAGTFQQRISMMIIGAEKAATTTLLRYLARHPKIHGHAQREMGFFTHEDQFVEGFERARSRYFSGVDSRDKILLAKNVGLLYSQVGLERLKEHNPDVILVVVLRNPIDRAYSAFWEMKRKGRLLEHQFEDVVFDSDGDIREDCSIINRSRYAPYVVDLLGIFNRDQLIPILFEEFIESPRTVCERLFSKLGTYSIDVVEDDLRAHNPASIAQSAWLARVMYSKSFMRNWKDFMRKVFPRRLLDRLRDFLRQRNEQPIQKPPMSSQTRKLLSRYFKESNLEIAKLLDLDISSWQNNASI